MSDNETLFYLWVLQINLLLYFTPEQPKIFRSNLAISSLRMQLLSNSIDEISYWESDSSWIGQEFSYVFWKQKFRCCVFRVHLRTVFWTSWIQITLSYSLSVWPATVLYSILRLIPWNSFCQVFQLKVCTHGSYRSRVWGCKLDSLSLIEICWWNSTKKTMCFYQLNDCQK